MKINRILLVFVSFLIISCSNSTEQENDELVKIQTKYGEMLVVLHDETPGHKKNFLEIAKSGKYDSTFFHRVIKDFMVQGGDTSRLKFGESNGTIPAEINNAHYHVKGALAAARKGDQINPNRESSACQFYIVQGKKVTSPMLKEMENRINFGSIAMAIRKTLQAGDHPELNQLFDSLGKVGNPHLINQKVLELRDKMVELHGPLKELHYSDKQLEEYTSVGGTPHLDGQYTVFGQVLSGLHIVDSIAAQSVDNYSKPVEDIFMNMSVVELKRTEITQKYGYTYGTTVDGKK